MGNALGAVKTADNGVSLRRYFTVLSWWVILVGAAMTGFGVWFFGFADFGWAGGAAAALWAFGCIFVTALAWGFVALGGLVADHIGNSWEPDGDPEHVPG